MSVPSARRVPVRTNVGHTARPHREPASTNPGSSLLGSASARVFASGRSLAAVVVAFRCAAAPAVLTFGRCAPVGGIEPPSFIVVAIALEEDGGNDVRRVFGALATCNHGPANRCGYSIERLREGHGLTRAISIGIQVGNASQKSFVRRDIRRKLRG